MDAFEYITNSLRPGEVLKTLSIKFLFKFIRLIINSDFYVSVSVVGETDKAKKFAFLFSRKFQNKILRCRLFVFP